MARYDDAVLRALGREPHFRSAQQVHGLLGGAPAGGVRGPSLSTVYRALRRLAAEGVLDTVHSSDGELLYRLCGGAAHHHLLCRLCGQVEEVPEPDELTALAERIGAAGGYRSLRYSFELSGICAGCAAEPDRPPPGTGRRRRDDRSLRCAGAPRAESGDGPQATGPRGGEEREGERDGASGGSALR
ncbi:Fur family transcriptional regulator [Nocardiopsis potens]|uniref:Fur family transcriptional regulator n=1 Tax=Nocardiopsis potens TaxID=1246458 RepID=UPI000347BA0F|nr:transcriptional repressor [Nocardiopsis potens]